MSQGEPKSKPKQDKRRQRQAAVAQHNNERDDQSRVGLLLIFLAVVVAFTAYLWPQARRASDHAGVGDGRNSIEQNSLQPSAAHLPPTVVNRINEHLKESQIESEIRQQSTQIENQMAPKAAPGDAAEYNPEAPNDRVNPLILDQVDPNARVIQDLKGGRTSSSSPPTPDQRISSKLAKERWVQQYEQEYQEEYVRQFKENARKDGLDVRVNKDLDVTGIGVAPVERPIRLPQSESPSGSK